MRLLSKLDAQIDMPAYEAGLYQGRSNRFPRLFVQLTAAVLMLTAALKILTASMESTELATASPVIPFLSVRQILLLASVAEVTTSVACWLCISRGRLDIAVEFIAYLASLFLAFRISAWLVGWGGPCYCLGLWTSPAYSWTAYVGEWLSKAILLWMLLGSYWQLLRYRKPLQLSAAPLDP